MMEIDQIVPEERRIPLNDLTTRLLATRPVAPFGDELLELGATISRAIFHDTEAKRYPELQALAFWMRKAELSRMSKAFSQLGTAETILAPRGLIFHIPPSNVDTIFVYSWLIAALTGNVNVIRLSERTPPQVAILCRLIGQALRASPEALREATTIVRYGHEKEVTAEISLISDVRVIWGGDATVALIRQHPLPPHGREVTFPDRKSLSALNAERYLQLSYEEGSGLAELFFNDAYWFDQMACSSPRLIVWCGSETDAAKAGTLFMERLSSQVKRRNYVPPDAALLERFTFTCRAILETPVSACRQIPELTMLDVSKPEHLPLDHCGGGLFFQTNVNSLPSLAPYLTRRDQTLTHFGFTREDLRDLSRELCGRAIDRIVPIGQALQFHRFWDGHDLLREFTRTVYIKS